MDIHTNTQSEQSEQSDKVQALYTLLDEVTVSIRQDKQTHYLEALIDSAESLFHQEYGGLESSPRANKMLPLIQQYISDAYQGEEKRKAFQLALLKGYKELVIPGTGMTPDTVCLLVAYLLKKFVPQPQRIYDPACGSGNLLTCVLNQYAPLQAWGTEVDALLVRLAFVNANLQNHEVEFFHQDALKSLPVPLVDVVVCDLPVGIYPNEENAQTFQLYDQDEQIYTHHLLIEQSLNVTLPGAYILFVIPNSLLSENGSDKLRALINEQTYIQAVLQLPEAFFQEGSIHKSVLMLQKKGDYIRRPKQVLLADLPSFHDKIKVKRMMDQVDEWVTGNKQ